MFESTSELPGTLTPKISKRSSTVVWLEATFETLQETATPLDTWLDAA